MQTPAMTHQELCSAAAKCLVSRFKCHFAITDLTTYAGEKPDAIGFKGDVSIVIEAKVSRADFLADKKKYYRKEGNGMGDHRFYICPTDMIKVEELPAGWGLIYFNGKKSRVIHCISTRERGNWHSDGTVTNKRTEFDPYENRLNKSTLSELTFLCSVVRRYANNCEYIKTKTIVDGKFLPFTRGKTDPSFEITGELKEML